MIMTAGATRQYVHTVILSWQTPVKCPSPGKALRTAKYTSSLDRLLNRRREGTPPAPPFQYTYRALDTFGSCKRDARV